MIIRKPTTITLKPEDDYQEYEEFKRRQDEQRKNMVQQKNEIFTSQQPQMKIHQAPKNTRRSIQQLQQEPVEFMTEAIFEGQPNQSNQIPVNQLFLLMNPHLDVLPHEQI